MTKYTLTLAVVVSTSLAVAACSKRVPPVAPAPAPSSSAVVAPPPPPPTSPAVVEAPRERSLSEDELFARKTLAELNAESPLGDVFFAFDESTLSEDARSVLQQNAQWLSRWGSTSIAIEGHADARGTAEYNLALGERRASALRDYLADLGIPAGRVLPLSKGEEQPFCTQDAESCWQQNRRGHFVITAK